MRIHVVWCRCLRIVLTVAFTSLFQGNFVRADEPNNAKLDPRIQEIPTSPFHGLHADGGVLAATESLIITAGSDYYSDSYYITLIKYPEGEILDKVPIAPLPDDRSFATASQDGSRVAFIQGDSIELRNVNAIRDVAHRIPIEADDVTSIALSNHGERLAVGTVGSVTFYNGQTGERLKEVTIACDKPSVFYTHRNQLGAFDRAGVWLAESSEQTPEIFLKTPDGFELKNALVFDNHCYAALNEVSGGNALADLLSGKFVSNARFVAKFDKQGNRLWQISSSEDLIAVNNDTLVVRNKNELVRTSDGKKLDVIGRCDWANQLKFSENGEFLVGVVRRGRGVETWESKSWKPHPANAIPFNVSASAIDDDGRVTVTSATSICTAEPGKPFQIFRDLPEDTSPYDRRHCLSGDELILARITKSDGVKLMNLADGKEIEVESRSDLKANQVWLNQKGSLAIIRYKNKEVTPGQAAQQGFQEGFLGRSTKRPAEPTDVLSLPTGKRIAEFEMGDLDILRTPNISGDRITYSTMAGIAHFAITPNKIKRTGTVYVPHTSQALSESGALVVGTQSGIVFRYETPTAPPKTVLRTNRDNRLIVGVSPDGQTAYCCEYDRERRQTLFKAILCSGPKVLWDQWLPSDPLTIQVSPAGKYLLLTMYDRWYVVRVEP